jgi:hypothetical protein
MGYGGHPTPRQIKLYTQGRIGAVDQLWIAEHIGYCNNCFISLYSARHRPHLSPARVAKQGDRRRRAR